VVHRLLAIVAVVVCCIAAGGCAASPRPVPITRSSGTAERSPGVGKSAGSGQPVATRPEVVVVDAAFQPQTISIRAGQTVTWVNKDRVAHAVTADQGAFDMPLPSGSIRTHQFTAPGTVAYTCRIHPANPFMHGRVVVS
jgi:plastocyanin